MLVGKNASGMYVIDEDYKIISYNLAAREIYPQLKRGEKCYHCLRNRETPCEICPVVNGSKVRRIIWNRDGISCVRLMLWRFRWNPAGQDMPLFFRIQRRMMRSAAE